MLRYGFYAVFSFLLLTSCASYEVVEMPHRSADVYPLSRTADRVTVAVDEISIPERVKRYFGDDLIKKGVLPVLVTVSNYGEETYLVSPSDILLHRGREVIDPLPTELVASLAKRASWRMTQNTSRKVDEYFYSIAISETILNPNESYQGVLFFPVIEDDKNEVDDFFTLTLFKNELKLSIAITSIQTNERVLFKGFPISI